MLNSNTLQEQRQQGAILRVDCTQALYASAALSPGD
jgi:hypothetical protein